jgi:DNA ligase (NAD+)
MSESFQEKMDTLAEKLLEYQKFYAQGRPLVSDLEYDRLFDELQNLEKMHPEGKRPWSPTERVGNDLVSDFPQVNHTVPVLSLDKVYKPAELSAWLYKNKGLSSRRLVVVLEQKMDGLSIVLTYEQGVLVRAATRGNGVVGNDVTANVKTLASVPLKLPEKVDLVVRGEVFIPKSLFLQINQNLEEPYANARNLAAGSLRRVKSSEVAAVPLQIFCYEGFFEGDLPSGHLATLARLKNLGFPLNPYLSAFSPDGEFSAAQAEALAILKASGKNWEELEAEVATLAVQRPKLDWDVDGLVLKVDDLALREELGQTGHHPRWALAYKFESPEGVTTIEDIFLQVGRTGRVTPVARVSPVAVGGSTITFVTLHNAAFIEGLELNVGDQVAISRRGDVIPAVGRVLEKNSEGTWIFPAFCPSCGSCLRQEGGHTFCPQPECPAVQRAKLNFFVAKDQMDIENLGPETVEVLVEQGLVKEPSDFFTCDYMRLLSLPGFGEKKVNLIREGVEKARQRPFSRVLTSLGVPELGPKLAELLIASGLRSFSTLTDALENHPETLLAIPGIGERTVLQLRTAFLKPRVQNLIQKLLDAGLSGEAPVPQGPESTDFLGTVWCVTGSFANFVPRSLAEAEIQKRSGRVSSAVSGATTHLLAGSNAGSKLDKAQRLGVRIVGEAEFQTWLELGLPSH